MALIGRDLPSASSLIKGRSPLMTATRRQPHCKPKTDRHHCQQSAFSLIVGQKQIVLKGHATVLSARRPHRQPKADSPQWQRSAINGQRQISVCNPPSASPLDPVLPVGMSLCVCQIALIGRNLPPPSSSAKRSLLLVAVTRCRPHFRSYANRPQWPRSTVCLIVSQR